jgi:hypothetical protein
MRQVREMISRVCRKESESPDRIRTLIKKVSNQFKMCKFLLKNYINEFMKLRTQEMYIH